MFLEFFLVLIPLTNEYVIIGQGVLSGVAYAFIHLPTVVILSQYFKKRRGLANSISVSGTSMGGLVFAPVVTAMFEYYGYSGTFLIVSGIVLNCWVAAALFRPLEFYKRKSKLRGKSIELKSLFSRSKSAASDSNPDMTGSQNPGDIHSGNVNGLRSNSTTGPILQRQLAIDDKTLDRFSDEELPMRGHKKNTLTPKIDIQHRPQFLRGKRVRTITESSTTSSISGVLESISQSDVARLASAENLYVSVWTENSLKEVEEYEINGQDFRRKICCNVSAIARSFRTIFDLELMKNPLFWTLLFQAALTCSGLVFMSVFLAPRARESGLEERQIGLLYSIMGIIDFLFRVITGFISDLKFIRRSTLIAIASLVDGILANCIPLFTTFPSFIICVCIHGVVGGVYFALFAVNLVDFLGMEKLGSCLGFTNLIHGVSIAVLFTTLGSLRDISGSYISSFQIVGNLFMLSFLVNMSAPYVERWVKKRRTSVTLKEKAKLNENV
ncbi:hypothetical protein CHS0354_011907 [Potamilus streckersoni]|uniref:Uncharacterized protein n=1 Tax=Potamilus streckersoni TaxID=2493646 RepID=A0AAE0SZZ9_9BIVA|nr:hypothetical protein CHS0354_011907 [Potamilus streckersoni]